MNKEQSQHLHKLQITKGGAAANGASNNHQRAAGQAQSPGAGRVGNVTSNNQRSESHGKLAGQGDAMGKGRQHSSQRRRMHS
jgi:hypothetical protein